MSYQSLKFTKSRELEQENFQKFAKLAMNLLESAHVEPASIQLSQIHMEEASIETIMPLQRGSSNVIFLCLPLSQRRKVI